MDSWADRYSRSVADFIFYLRGIYTKAIFHSEEESYFKVQLSSWLQGYTEDYKVMAIPLSSCQPDFSRWQSFQDPSGEGRVGEMYFCYHFAESYQGQPLWIGCDIGIESRCKSSICSASCSGERPNRKSLSSIKWYIPTKIWRRLRNYPQSIWKYRISP